MSKSSAQGPAARRHSGKKLAGPSGGALDSPLFVREFRRTNWRFLAAVLLLSLAGSTAQAAPPSRIHEDLDDGQTFLLRGNIHPLVASLPDAGEVSGSLALPRITIEFKMSDAQQAKLNELLSAQQNAANPSFHKWLTPEEFGQQFGLNAKDLDKIKQWLRNQGFSDIAVSRSRTSISMSGTAAHAQYAFQTSIHKFQLNGALHFANIADPAVPQALRGVVTGVRGLTDIHPKPRAIARRASAQPRFTSSVSNNHFLAPGDFATIYDVQALYDNGIDGTGEKIAIAGQTDIQVSDIEAFQTASGLTVKAPTVVLDGTDPGTQKDDLSEASLDVEWAGAVARGATIVYVNSNDAFNSAIYAIDNNLANVLSLTYGLCESQAGSAEIASLDAAFQQANAQGMTIVAASGDAGAADCDSSFGSDSTAVTSAKQGLTVDFPASSPYVTGMGGTELNEGAGSYWNAVNSSTAGSALSYIPEIAWNDSIADGELSASGGGASTVFGKPVWQTGAGVPNDAHRDVPDLSLDASPSHDGYLICSKGSCVSGFRMADQTLTVIGGTSAASPTFAGIVALVDQFTGAAQGNINPRLYALAAASTDAFHDITAGSNQVPCTLGTPDCSAGTLGYVAGAGYDQVTGLGTVDAYNFVHEWSPNFSLSVNPTTLTIGGNSSGSASITVSSVGTFTGTVSFSCAVPATLTNTACSIPGTVASAGSATLTITNSNSASSSPRFPNWRPPLNGSLLLLVTLGVMLTAIARRKTGPAWSGVAILSVAMMTSCGGGSNNATSQIVTPTVTGTVTVTATAPATSLSSAISRTITIAVTEP